MTRPLDSASSQDRGFDGDRMPGQHQCRLPNASGKQNEPTPAGLDLKPNSDAVLHRCSLSQGISGFQTPTTKPKIRNDNESRTKSAAQTRRADMSAQHKEDLWDVLGKPMPARHRQTAPPSLQTGGIWDVLDHEVKAERTQKRDPRPSQHVARTRAAAPTQQHGATAASRGRHHAAPPTKAEAVANATDAYPDIFAVDRAYKRDSYLLAGEDSAPWAAINKFVTTTEPKRIDIVLRDLKPGLAQVVRQQALQLNKAYAALHAPDRTPPPASPVHSDESAHADNIKALRALKADDVGAENNETAWQTVNAFVSWATAPLREERGSRWQKDAPQLKVNDAMDRLERETRQLDPRIAAAVVNQFLVNIGGLEQFDERNREDLANDHLYGDQGDGPGLNPRVDLTAFMTIADHIAGTPPGDAAVSRLVALAGWPAWPGGRYVSAAIGKGAGFTYALEAARQLEAKGGDPEPVYKAISRGLELFKEKTQRDYEALRVHRNQLAAVIKDIAPVATADELVQISENFLKDHPDWKQKDDELQRCTYYNGLAHLQHLISLDPKGRDSAFDARIRKLLQEGITDHEATRVAMSMAVHNEPTLSNVDSTLFRKSASFFVSLTKAVNPNSKTLVEFARKMAGELAAEALHHQLISMLQSHPLDARGLFAFQEEVRALVNRDFARYTGISPNALGAISNEIDELINEMLAVDGLNNSPAARTIGLQKFSRNLDRTKAFSVDTVAGRVMRGFAATLALAGTVFSLKKMIDDPTALNAAKAGVDAASAVQKTSDLLRSLGVKNSVVRGVGGSWKVVLRTGAKIGASELLSLASTVLDGAKAIDCLTKGDLANAGFSAVIATGGAVSMLPVFFEVGSIAGPLGIAIMTVAFIGQTAWQNAKHMHDGEEDVKKGLILLGYNAEHAAILSRRGTYSSATSGQGQMLGLMNYAKSQGMNAKELRDWINSMTPRQVEDLSELVFYEMGVGNGNFCFEPDEAKRHPYLPAPMVVASRYGSVGRANDIPRRTAADFAHDLARRDIPRPLPGGGVI
jgi:hypothetical protein